MVVVKAIYAIYAFAVEIAMLVALALWAASLAGGVVGAVLAVGVVAVVAVFWGAFLSPKAQRPVARPISLGLKLVLFVGTGLLLATAGFGIFGVLLIVAGLTLLAFEATVGSAAEVSQEPDEPVN